MNYTLEWRKVSRSRTDLLNSAGRRCRPLKPKTRETIVAAGPGWLLLLVERGNFDFFGEPL